MKKKDVSFGIPLVISIQRNKIDKQVNQEVIKYTDWGLCPEGT